MHLVAQREMNLNNNGGGPCGACKFLRRKCVKGCVFAPYFEPDDSGTADFEAVHRVFGAKLLLRTPANTRLYAVVSLCYEALSRIVYGCVAQVFNLKQQVDCLQAQVAYVQARLSMLKDRRALCQSPTNLLMLSGSSLTSVDFGQTSSCFSSEGNVSVGEPLFEQVDVEILARDVLTHSLPNI